MRTSHWLSSLFALCVISLLSACGEAPPKLEDVEAQLTTPTGTIDANLTKSTYLGYTRGQVALKNPSLSKYGQLPQFLEVEGAATKVADHKTFLIRSGIPAQAAEILLPYLPINNDHSRKEIDLGGNFGRKSQSQFAGLCVSGDLLGFAAIGTGRGSAEVAIDLGCTGEGKGRIVIRFTVDAALGSGFMRFDILFQNVCNNAGDCVDGAMLYRMNIQGTTTGASGDILMSMALRATTASGETAFVKQGLRIAFDASKKAGNLEILVFLKDAEGKEVSAVLQIQAQAGTASFSIRGANGSFSCSTQDSGKSGSCESSKGDKITW